MPKFQLEEFRYLPVERRTRLKDKVVKHHLDKDLSCARAWEKLANEGVMVSYRAVCRWCAEGRYKRKLGAI